MSVDATLSALQEQNQRLYNALAKMFLWQADRVNELMPDDLSDEVRALLGENMVDAIIGSDGGQTFESIQKGLKS